MAIPKLYRLLSQVSYFAFHAANEHSDPVGNHWVNSLLDAMYGHLVSSPCKSVICGELPSSPCVPDPLDQKNLLTSRNHLAIQWLHL